MAPKNAPYCTDPLKMPVTNQDMCMSNWTKKLFEKIGCRLESSINLSMPRSFRMLEDGYYDMMVGITPTQKRKKKFTFSDPILNQFIYIMARRNSLESQNVKSLCDTTMKKSRMVHYENLYLGENSEILKRPEAECYREVIGIPGTMADAARLLSLGRADLAPASYEGWNSLIKYKPDLALSLVILDIELDKTPLSIAFNKKTEPKLIEDLNAAISQTKDDLSMCTVPDVPLNSSGYKPYQLDQPLTIK